MTFSAPIIWPIVGQARRVGDRAGRDDRPLARHQARHRGDRADPARVRQRDVARRRGHPPSACSCAPSRPARRRRRGSARSGIRPPSRITGTISVRWPIPDRSSFFSTSTARPRLTCPSMHAVGLAVDLLEVVRHHRHVVRRAGDRVGDQVREGDLALGCLQLACAARRASSPSACGSSSPSGSSATAPCSGPAPPRRRASAASRFLRRSALHRRPCSPPRARRRCRRPPRARRTW